MAKIVGLMVCGPGEADRYLQASLDEFSRLCDDAVICLNNADEKTKAMVKASGFWWYESDREWGKYQPYIKTELLAKIWKLKPDIILPLDADEVYDQGFTREQAEKWGSQYPGCYFRIIDLWDEPTRHRESMSFWNIRMFSGRRDLGHEYVKKNLHCGLAPGWAYQYGAYVPFMVKHYGLMKREDRMRKVERYKKYDPDAIFKDKSYYDALAEEATGSYFDEEQYHNKLAAEVARYGDQHKKIVTMPEKQFVMVKNLKTGSLVDIPEELLESHLKRTYYDIQLKQQRPEFEFVKKIELDVVIPDIEDPFDTGKKTFECPICGFGFETEKALNGHRTRKHK